MTTDSDSHDSDSHDSDSDRFTEASVPAQLGRTALITGANTGIGYEAARVLAGKGARVLLACRTRAKAEDAIAEIISLHPKADCVFVELDLNSLASIRAAAQSVLDTEGQLDLLINNAGIMMPPRQETEDGFESQFGVNHLGHFALTGLLLPLVMDTAGSRVVTVSSLAHKGSDIDFEDLHAHKRYGRQSRYGMSKLANLLFAYELQRRLSAKGSETISVACHPGVSLTDLGRNLPGPFQTIWPMMRFVIPNQAPPRAALPTLRAATDPEVQGGEYYGPSGLMEMRGPAELARSTARSHNRELAAKLWQVSVDLTGVEPPV